MRASKSEEQRQAETEEACAAVCAWLLEAFIQRGKDLSAAEIAAGLGWPTTRVRRALRGRFQDHGIVVKEHRKVTRTTTGQPTGTHRVDLYGPTREALRTYIMESRQRLTAEVRKIADQLRGADLETGAELAGELEKGHHAIGG